jgi:hypothetical protein
MAATEPTDEDIETIARYSPLVHFATYAQIFDKKNQQKQPVPNILQRRINEAIMVLQALGLAVRILVTKIRQCGGSTFSLEVGYHLSRNRKVDALITADVAANSNKMIERLGDFGRMDTYPWNNQFRQVQGKMTVTNGAEFAIDSAERPNAGVSRTRQFFLASETPKWPRTGVKNDEKVMAAIMPSIPNEPGTIIISEGTPNGAAGWQYKMWQKALWLEDFVKQLQAGNPSPGNGWVKIFAAWFEFEENVKPLTPEQKKTVMASLDTEEMLGIQKWKWTAEQIAWRRATIASECGGSVEAFREYFPSDDVTCLVAGTRIGTCSTGLIRIGDGGSTFGLVGSYSEHGRVEAWKEMGTRDVVRVTTSLGFQITCTPDHLIHKPDGSWLPAGDSNGQLITLEQPRLMDDAMGEGGPVAHWDGFSGIHSHIQLDYEWCKFLGYYCGDGSLYKNQLDICGDAKDDDVREWIEDFCRRKFGTVRVQRPRAAKCWIARHCSHHITALLQAMGVTQTGKHGSLRRLVTVPAPIWTASAKYVGGFLQGLFEADGHVRRTGRTIYFHSKSEEFCRDVQLLLFALGVTAQMGKVMAKLNGKVYPGWRLVIRTADCGKFYDKVGFISARKRAFADLARAPYTGGRPAKVRDGTDTVVSVEPAGSEKVYDIQIDGKPMFSASGIRVHNCWLGSGRPRFDQMALAAMQRRSVGINPKTGRLVLQSDGETVAWSEDPTGGGDILMYEDAREGCRYLVWCDPMTGEDQTESSDPDHHSIGVIRAAYMDEHGNHHHAAVVARVRPPCTAEGDVVAMYIANLSSHYGRCTVVLEINMGLHILVYLKQRGCNIYKREVPDPMDRSKPKYMYGFKTKDHDTKRQITDCLAIHIREQTIELNDPTIFQQCRVFMYDKNGHETAPSGEKDDDVIGLGMGMLSIGGATLYVEPRRRRKLPRDHRAWEQVAAGHRR